MLKAIKIIIITVIVERFRALKTQFGSQLMASHSPRFTLTLSKCFGLKKPTTGFSQVRLQKKIKINKQTNTIQGLSTIANAIIIIIYS